MTQQRVEGFVVAVGDMVHGKPTDRVRIKDPKNQHNGRKCRVASTGGGYEPRQSDVVTFVVGTTVDSGTEVLVAYDVRPSAGTQRDSERTEQPDGTMNWFLVQFGDRVYATCLGFRSLEEAQAELGEDEQVLAFVPFDISDHAGEYDDPDIESGFEMVRALSALTPTLQALEKLVTVLVREAVRQKA